MKNFTKAIALCLALLLCLSCPIGVCAAEVADATIDFTQKGSLTIYKIDLTNAEKDGMPPTITKVTTPMFTSLPTLQYREKAISVSRGWRSSARNSQGIFSHRS